MKLKIISDGTNSGTKLINQETGESVELVQEIQWFLDVNEVYSLATIKLAKIPVEIVSEATIYQEKSKVMTSEKTIKMTYECTEEEFEDACKQINKR